MHQLLLRVILPGAVLPVAVGLIDDHLRLLLAVIPVQVFLEVSQLLLGRSRAQPLSLVPQLALSRGSVSSAQSVPRPRDVQVHT